MRNHFLNKAVIKFDICAVALAPLQSALLTTIYNIFCGIRPPSRQSALGLKASPSQSAEREKVVAMLFARERARDRHAVRRLSDSKQMVLIS